MLSFQSGVPSTNSDNYGAAGSVHAQKVDTGIDKHCGRFGIRPIVTIDATGLPKISIP